MKEERRDENEKKKGGGEEKNASLLPFIFVVHNLVPLFSLAARNPPFLGDVLYVILWTMLRGLARRMLTPIFLSPPAQRRYHDRNTIHPSPLRRPGAIRPRRRTQPLNRRC